MYAPVVYFASRSADDRSNRPRGHFRGVPSKFRGAGKGAAGLWETTTLGEGAGMQDPGRQPDGNADGGGVE